MCFGRGIEQVMENGTLTWKPTAYLECLTPQYKHSGYRTNGIALSDCNDGVMIAGAHANVMATAHRFLAGVRENNPPQLLAWAAGRPDYLKNAPETVSEGSILFAEFLRRVGDPLQLAPDLVVRLQTNNRNTRDDLLESLTMAQEMDLEKIIVVSVLVHLPRIAEFHACALKANPSLAKIQVEFLASELVLLGKGVTYHLLLLDDREVAGQFEDVKLARIVDSPAYRRTALREAIGIEALRAGRYDFAVSSAVTLG